MRNESDRATCSELVEKKNLDNSGLQVVTSTVTSTSWKAKRQLCGTSRSRGIGTRASTWLLSYYDVSEDGKRN
jgi:hypothetical protein